jgi:hypothetical protein
VRMAEELFEELRRCGAQVEARGQVLHVEAPRGALSPELVRSLVVEVWSAVLKEAAVFASDDARVDPGELRTVYRAHELRVLLGLTTPRELRRVHEVKRLFRGTITYASSARGRLRP